MGKRVLCCGTFDYLHPGHISFLKQAARLGTELFVVVARDENVKRLKGRYPDHGEEERVGRLKKVEVANEVHLGHSGSHFLQIVEELQPDIIALGYDQVPPAGLAESFPLCQIVILDSHHPEKYKSTLLRQAKAAH